MPLDYEKNFWMCPRVFDEYWGDLNKSECKLLICILRKVLGWDKKRIRGWDYISQSQFIKYTGLSKNSITEGIKSLVEKGFIRIGEETMHDGTKKYELVMSDGSDDGGSNFDRDGQILNIEGSKNDQSGSDFEQDGSKSEHTINNNNKEINIEKNIKNIFLLYKEKIFSEEILNKKGEDDARKSIEKRLRAFSCEQLETAIDNFSRNEWRMEHNRCLGIRWFFKSDEQIYMWLNLPMSPMDKKETLRRGSFG